MIDIYALCFGLGVGLLFSISNKFVRYILIAKFRKKPLCILSHGEEYKLDVITKMNEEETFAKTQSGSYVIIPEGCIKKVFGVRLLVGLFKKRIAVSPSVLKFINEELKKHKTIEGVKKSLIKRLEEREKLDIVKRKKVSSDIGSVDLYEAQNPDIVNSFITHAMNPDLIKEKIETRVRAEVRETVGKMRDIARWILPIAVILIIGMIVYIVLQDYLSAKKVCADCWTMLKDCQASVVGRIRG